MEADEIFWERLADMPDIEAVEELKIRRVQTTELATELTRFIQGRFGAQREEAANEIRSLNLLLTKINEEMKMRNRRIDNVSWRNAVRTVLGEDAYLACREWIIINGH